MKNLKRLSIVATAILLTAWSAFAGVPSHRFNGTWFKLRLNAKGRTYDAGDGTIARRNFTQNFYLQFVPTEMANEYAMNVWTRIGTEWVNTTTSTNKTRGLRENFVPDMYLQIYRNSSNNVETYSTPYITSSTNGTGGIRRATFNGTGEIYYGSINGNEYYGYCTFHGTKIEPSRLPFDP
jgi:hypothetical protein